VHYTQFLVFNINKTENAFNYFKIFCTFPDFKLKLIKEKNNIY